MYLAHIRHEDSIIFSSHIVLWFIILRKIVELLLELLHIELRVSITFCLVDHENKQKFHWRVDNKNSPHKNQQMILANFQEDLMIPGGAETRGQHNLKRYQLPSGLGISNYFASAISEWIA